MKILKTVNLKGFGKKHQGKVRDFYLFKDKRILITTDRISAFDVILGLIPYKGQVLNELSAFWFEKTSDIVPSHIISIPHPSVTIAKNVKLIPIEMVVRGYISGVTNTSIWGSYQKGERIIYGIKFPDGLRKNQKLKTPVITPTTKAEKGHDLRLTEKEILKKKIVDPKIWRQMKKAAIEIFERGQKICNKAGIILVDTKYEFGLDEKGKLLLIDEIHTPDSSRFWIKKTYADRFKRGLEPENFDKEFLRLWYAKRGYKGDGKPPKMTRDLRDKVSTRYISIYQKITGKKFKPAKSTNREMEKLIKTFLNNERKYKKFALIGTSSVGKTTLIQKLEKRLVKTYGQDKVSISQEAARYYFSNKKVRKPFSYFNQGKVQELAQKFEERLQENGFKYIICDRSVIDAVAYVHATGDKKGSEKLRKRMKEWLLTYDHLFLLDPRGVRYQSDRVRQEDEKTRNNFHKSFVTILESSNLPYTLISGDKKERVNKMLKIISASSKK